ncbi:TolC family protein [Myxosarcina sp. GI1]|uniref:TolC family protein n=1 Tax=Myxosarcina sp. GI1 TaxID=1541065 RepID=UPI0020A17452|nr:TolC family protein [Myxosarcina sp. GI1]
MWLNLPMLVLFAVFVGSVNPQMAASQPKLPSWSDRTEKPSESEEDKNLPCSNSSNKCVGRLTELAIANSNKLQQTSDRITAIERRLAVTEDRIDYTSKKKWTNYITTNPVDIIQNLFGGGGMQRDNLAIANLEIRTADLLAAKAELERQQEAEKLKLEDEVLHLLLDYEAANRKHELLSSQLETLEQQREVVRIAYKYGRGSTSQILGMENRRDRLTEQLTNLSIDKDESVRKLLHLIGQKSAE